LSGPSANPFEEVQKMSIVRVVLMAALFVLAANVAPAQEDLMDGEIGGPDVGGEAVGVGDEPVGGEEAYGEAVGVGDEPVGGEEAYGEAVGVGDGEVGGPAVDGEPIGEEDEPIGGEPLY